MLKKETVPKSESVSIATRESPTTIAGLAEGKITLEEYTSDEGKPKNCKGWR